VLVSVVVVPVIVVGLPVVLVPVGRWCSSLLLSASTHDPPCEQWLTGLGVGAGSSVVVVSMGSHRCNRFITYNENSWLVKRNKKEITRLGPK
jgi:hypothetical protein